MQKLRKISHANLAIAIVTGLSVVIVGYSIFASRAATTKSADLNNDGTVSIFDLSILLSKWNQTGTQDADLNLDNIVNVFDLSILLSQWGQAVTTQECTNPIYTTSSNLGGIRNNGYYISNNIWNPEEAGPQTLYVCSYKNWYVVSQQPDLVSNPGSVKTYPNVHWDINYPIGYPVSNYSTITSTFAAAGPRLGKYNVAYDLWLDGVGWGNGTTEIMIWTENYRQWPPGTKQATYSLNGVSYDVYRYTTTNDGGVNLITFLPSQPMYSGTLNLKAIVDFVIGKSWLSANAPIVQIDYGVEIASTDNTPQKFIFTDFSVTMQ
jgi:hypothetical protein